MARPKRNPATVSEITEAFSDFSTADQEGLLSTLTEICRILKRERSRIKPDLPMSQRLHDYLADIHDQVQAARFPTSITAPLPTEWLTAPDAELVKQVAANALPEDHEQ